MPVSACRVLPDKSDDASGNYEPGSPRRAMNIYRRLFRVRTTHVTTAAATSAMTRIGVGNDALVVAQRFRVVVTEAP